MLWESTDVSWRIHQERPGVRKREGGRGREVKERDRKREREEENNANANQKCSHTMRKDSGLCHVHIGIYYGVIE